MYDSMGTLKRLPNNTSFRYSAGNTAFNVRVAEHVACSLNQTVFQTLMQNLKNLRLHNYPFGDGDWRAVDQFEQTDPTKETISELEQIAKLSLYRSKGKGQPDFRSAAGRPHHGTILKNSPGTIS